MKPKPVVVIGAGLSRLCFARLLLKHDIDVVVLEAQDDIGGGVRTDHVDGFLLDRGFQVLQTAYPEAAAQLDYQPLRLHNFEPGALIRTRGRMVEMSDPWRRPAKLLSTAFNGIGTFSDRLKLAKLRWHVTHTSIDDLWQEPESTTLEYLRTTCGLSAGQSLISVSVVGEPESCSDDVENGVRRQLREWFGTSVDSWSLLRRYYIPYAYLLSQPTFEMAFLCPHVWSMVCIIAATILKRRLFRAHDERTKNRSRADRRSFMHAVRGALHLGGRRRRSGRKACLPEAPQDAEGGFQVFRGFFVRPGITGTPSSGACIPEQRQWMSRIADRERSGWRKECADRRVAKHPVAEMRSN